MSEPRLLEHNGKRILRLDYAGLTPPEIIVYMQEAKRLIAAEPNRSVRLLSIAPVHITDDVLRALKEFAEHNVPFVLASAIVGASPLLKAALVLAIVGRRRRNVETFDDELSAKNWLAER